VYVAFSEWIGFNCSERQYVQWKNCLYIFLRGGFVIFIARIIITVGEVYVISTKTYGVLHFMHVPGSVKTVRYSPDGKLFAVATKDSVLVYAAPCATLQFNPCELRQSYAVRDAVDLEWSDDAVLLAATSSEGTIDIHPLQKYWNFKAFVVTGNSVGTLRSFFLKNSYDFYTVER